MGKAGDSKLTEDQILALLAARRRAARLQSLQRIASLGRTATVGSHPALPAANRLFTGTAHDYAPHLGAGQLTAEATSPASAPEPGPWTSRDGWLAPAPTPVQPQHLHPLGYGGRHAAASMASFIHQQRWALWRDRVLLLVEMAALVALVIVVTGSFSSMGALNAELAESRRAPVAIAAAPLATEEELPGASSPPSAGSAAPGPVSSLVQPGVIVPIATPGAQAASRIVIPAIDVDSVIVEGDTWEDLKKGVGHHAGTANAGEKGNAVYSGHDDVYGEVFRRLEELKPGDVVTVHAGIHLYRYEVKRIRIVSPKETSVLSATSDATLTLITCYPYRVDTQRLVVIAKLVE